MEAHITPVRRFSYMTPLQKPKRRYRRFLQKRCNILPILNNHLTDNVIILDDIVRIFGRLLF